MTKKAEPQFSIMDRVTYRDHHKRLITGRVISIEARWSPWGRDPNVEPFITYTIEHPSYRNRRMYVGQSEILGKETAA